MSLDNTCNLDLLFLDAYDNPKLIASALEKFQRPFMQNSSWRTYFFAILIKKTTHDLLVQSNMPVLTATLSNYNKLLYV